MEWQPTREKAMPMKIGKGGKVTKKPYKKTSKPAKKK